MMYAVLFYEFFKIGLFAVGGGAATIPFLFDLCAQYDWFTAKDLADMIAVSESTPGPIGVNMATFSGFKAAGILGGIVATLGLVTPSVIIISLISRLLKTYACSPVFQNLLSSVRPAVLALILYAFFQILIISAYNFLTAVVFFILTIVIYFYKASPIFYMVLSAVIGVLLKL